jgi:hypothetical protein
MIYTQSLIRFMKNSYEIGKWDSIPEVLDALVDYIVYHQVTEDREFVKALGDGYYK